MVYQERKETKDFLDTVLRALKDLKENEVWEVRQD